MDPMTYSLFSVFLDIIHREVSWLNYPFIFFVLLCRKRVVYVGKCSKRMISLFYYFISCMCCLVCRFMNGNYSFMTCEDDMIVSCFIYTFKKNDQVISFSFIATWKNRSKKSSSQYMAKENTKALKWNEIRKTHTDISLWLQEIVHFIFFITHLNLYWSTWNGNQR